MPACVSKTGEWVRSFHYDATFRNTPTLATTGRLACQVNWETRARDTPITLAVSLILNPR